MWLHVLLRETRTVAARRSDASYSPVVPSQHQRIPSVLPISYNFLPVLISGDPQSLKRLSPPPPTGTSLVTALRLVDNFVECAHGFPFPLIYIPFRALLTGDSERVPSSSLRTEARIGWTYRR